MKSRIKGVRISGIACVVPSGVRTIEEDAHLFGKDHIRINRLKRDIGVNKRHITLNEECTSDLCAQAAQFLFTKINYDSSKVDCLIFISQTPDYFQPATSFVLHHFLGLSKDCAVFDINLGCSGYVYGLWLGSLIISSCQCNGVLLLAGDTISRCVSPFDPTVAPLFGDAGSATILEPAPEGYEMVFALHSDGEGYKNLIIPAGGFRKRPSSETVKMIQGEDGNLRSEEHLYMNGPEIFNFSIKEVPSVIEEVLAASNWVKEDVDFFIFHQANKFIIQNIVRKLKIPIEKVPYDVFEKYGNQSSASIPVTICEDLSTLLINNSFKVVLAGFGAGLSWAACTLILGPTLCFPVLIHNQ